MNESTTEELGIGNFIRLILMQSKIIILVVFLVFAGGISNYFLSDRVYKITSLLQVYSNNSPMMNEGAALDFVLGSSTNDINNLISLYKSRNNILDIISNLNLNFLIEDLPNESTVDLIDFEGTYNFYNKTNNSLAIIFHNSYYEIFDSKDNLITKTQYDDLYEDNNFKILIGSNNNVPLNKKFNVEIFHPEAFYKRIKNGIEIYTTVKSNSFYSRGDGLIEVSYITNKPSEGIKLINYANNLFIKNNIETETEKARKAISFIDAQLQTINTILETNKSKLKSFKEDNQSINVDLEIKSIIENIANIEQQINKIDLELATALNDYTQDNPIYISLSQQKNALLSQKALIQEKIKDLPIAEQTYIDLYRDVEISQELYSELMSTKLGYSILEASTIGNIRVVDSAYKESIVSPKLSSIIIAVSISFFIMLLFALYRGLFLLPISNPAELADNGIKIPILGVLLKVEEDGDVLENDRLNQALESLLVNVSSIDQANKVILFTSANPTMGKSFISRVFARKLAETNKKVLLLDLDLKRGQQKKFFSKFNEISNDDFWKLDEKNIEKQIVDKNLYLIPRIKGLSNSFQYTFSEAFKEKISHLRNIFDYIIIDTAPVLSVSDTSLLMSYSDLNIAICRHEKTKINELKQIIHLSHQIGMEFDGIVYNAYTKPSGYYGYYDYYGNYSYQYYADRYLYDEYKYE